MIPIVQEIRTSYSSYLSVDHIFLTSGYRVSNVLSQLLGMNICLLLTHVGHSKCVRFGSPHTGQRLIFMASFSAFPAICLCRFLLWDVFFLGTARRTESQRSASNDDTVDAIAAGRNRLDEG